MAGEVVDQVILDLPDQEVQVNQINPLYQFLEKIGKGGYGVVFKARETRTRNIVAVKTFMERSSGIPNTTIREIAILKELQHPNVIKMIDIVVQLSKMYLILEYYDMNLKEYIKSTQREGMTDNHIKSFLHQIVSGLHYCHSHGIIHRDLKPHNVLINHTGRVCIADFGLSRTFDIRSFPFTPRNTTLTYRAPEMLLSVKDYSLPVDIWSIGCIFIECMTLQALFRCDTEVSQIISIFKIFGKPTESVWQGVESLDYFDNSYPDWKPIDLKKYVFELSGYIMNELALDLLKQMFIYDPRKRITAKNVSVFALYQI
ncbi:cyclin-dependent kinase 2 [Cunninghamella echinulata]|nr:cyclin-dependent kinase 2 [Cunninghamella echinulata]